MYDCIVVGAGPSGGSAAYHLAKHKHSVLVLEKELLPRYKPCGGGVPPSVQRWFDFDFKPAVSLTVNQVRYTWQMGDPQLVELGLAEPMWMVRRDIFDHHLIKEAQKLGAEVRDNTEVTGIKWQSDRWLVTVKNADQTEVLEAKYLIAADGARGSMAKWLGFKERKKRMGAALEVEAKVDTNNDATLHFDFGAVNNGYIWNFPKADGYSIGIGTFRGGEEKQNLKEIAQEYAQTFGVDLSAIKQYGHPLCLWDGDMPLHTQNALLTGEAACIVDPFTAEGIRPALFTGMLAAQAIAHSLNGDREALKNYTKRVQEEWGADMAWAQRLAGLFYRVPKFAYKVGIKRPAATKRMGKLLSGEERYRDIADAAIKRLTKGLIPGMG
ncbi:geranylgeranyl reductase family protein [Synechococcus sp. PCC 7502]|uniref:geranylgeranyl reductase family protein n=1 Tax=Synechococcus sp. PCC 7502 TaxID=1173263 RepID=UPI00029FCEBC|nr:geranylgeranyl reductase family protein [Synechococcus sp. PCC 7502]AFY74275.1 geranylgeranyl reductase family protein [Synechococcus sp. PCC 7502]